MDNLGGSPLENSGVYVVLAMLHESSGQHELAKMHAIKAVDCHDLHTGTRLENSKNEADKAQYAKPFPPEQAPPAIGRFDPETAFEKIGNNYRPSVVTFDKFNGIQQLIPEIPVPLVMWPLTKYSALFQAQIRSDWDSAMIKLFKATRTAIQSKDSNFFLRFSGFDTHNQLFNYYRAIFDCIGGQKSTYQLLSLVQLTADAYNMELSQFASTKNAISQRASDVGSIPGLVHANEIAALSMRAGKLGKAVPEISTDLTTPMGLADVYQHVEGSLRRNPNLQAHGAIMQSQAPAGFYFACNGCHRKVKDPTTHRCAPNPNNNTNNHNNNNRGRGSNRGRGRGQRGASNAPGGLPPYNSPAARGAAHTGTRGAHHMAHFTGMDSQALASGPPSGLPLQFYGQAPGLPSYPPPHGNPWAQMPGSMLQAHMCRHPPVVSYSHVYSPYLYSHVPMYPYPQAMAYYSHPNVTRIIDCGASFTTVGSNTPLRNASPCSMLLRTTQGYTSNLVMGTCSFVFPDKLNVPVTMELQAISSPDIHSDIVLISFFQLLFNGYKVNLFLEGGYILTPSNQEIILSLRDGVWHFPDTSAPTCLFIPGVSDVHMVLGRGRAGWPSQAQSALPQPEVPSLSNTVCLESEPHVSETDVDVPTSSHPVSVPVAPVNTCENVLCHDPHGACHVPPASAIPAEAQCLPSLPATTGTDRQTEGTRRQTPGPPARTTPTGPDLPSVSPSDSSMSKQVNKKVDPPLGQGPPKSRQRVGVNLSPQQAMEICAYHHVQLQHCDKATLRSHLRLVIPVEADRPSDAHIREFVCASCAMAKSKKPPQKKTHPPSSYASGYSPGQYLYIDGSGSYNFKTLDGSTQHFIITCAVSHAKFCLPSSDKKPATLIMHLKRLRANWKVQFKRLRVDQEWARSHEFQYWATQNDIAIEETPPYVHAPNGKVERAHGVVQDLARTQRVHAGAGDLLWAYSIRYAAKLCNHKPTTADSAHRSPLQIDPSIPYQHTQLQLPPWGCQMFAHVGQRTDRSTASASRAIPGIFVGIADHGPSYLMYDLDKNRVLKVGYATFDVHNFPLKNMLLAGQAFPKTAAIDAHSWRKSAFLCLDELPDEELVEFCSGVQMIVEVPQSFFPEYKHAWRMQVHRPSKDASGKTVAVLLYDRYHGPTSALPKDMRNYATHPKESVFSISPSKSGPDYSLRHVLRLTYPTCMRMADMASASTNSKGVCPPHPAVQLAQAAFTNINLFYTYEMAKNNPLRLRHAYAHAARLVGSTRVPPVKLPSTGSHFITPTGLIGFTPNTRREALRHPSAPRWLQAELDECAGIRARGVVQAVPVSEVPAGVRILRHRFVYVDKSSGPKARLCARGDEEWPYPSASETYASTPSASQVRLVVAHAAHHGRDLLKLDVSQAFTQADAFGPDVHIYMYPPEGQEPDGFVWRLLRPLYGLAVAPAYWSQTLRTYLETEGWTPVCAGDQTMYKYEIQNNNNNNLHPSDNLMFLIFHVDDILLSVHPSHRNYADSFKTAFMHRFDARDEGPVTRYVGVDIHRVKDRIYLTQTPLIQELVDTLGLSECNPTLTPMEPGTRLYTYDRPQVPDGPRTKLYQHTVGVLQYLNQWTRPDIAYAVYELSRHQSNPGEVHMDAAKRVVRYLRGTSNYGLVYRFLDTDSDRLIGFADADWAGDDETRKSLSANVYMCNGGAISWFCKQQDGVACSTMEAEYVSASWAANQAVYLRRVMEGMRMVQPGPTPIYEDNRACIFFSEHSILKTKTRHINVAMYNARDHVHKNEIRLMPCPTNDMAADALTKALPAPSFRRHRDTILGYTLHTAPRLPPRIASWRLR